MSSAADRLPVPDSPSRSTPQPDKALGTPYYMSLEQARDAKSADARADIYSAGVLVYEMLTAQRPVAGDNNSEVLWNLWHEPVMPLRAHRPELSLELESVVLRAMHRDPRRRFRSARQLAVALSEAVGLEPDTTDARYVSRGTDLVPTGPTASADRGGSFPPSAITKTLLTSCRPIDLTAPVHVDFVDRTDDVPRWRCGGFYAEVGIRMGDTCPARR